jgi:hypothetical protein
MDANKGALAPDKSKTQAHREGMADKHSTESSSEHLDQKIAYIPENPARSGLVCIPDDYALLLQKPVLLLATNGVGTAALGCPVAQRSTSDAVSNAFDNADTKRIYQIHLPTIVPRITDWNL